MSFEKPDEGRASIIEGNEEITIVIPSKKNYFIILFMLFWLGGWVMGEVTVIGTFLLGKMPAGGKLFSLFWLGGWTIGGAFAILSIMWQIFGKEIVNVTNEIVKIEKNILGLKKSKEYGVEYIKNLRIGNVNNSWFNNNRNQEAMGMLGGNIFFDYGMKTVRFGHALEEAESKHLIEKMEERIQKL